MTTHYETLGIEETATEAEIKKAYRSLSFQYHPDRYSGEDANTRMQQINEAYEILREPAKREAYDNERNGVNNFPTGFPGFPMGPHGGIFNPFNLFSQMGVNFGNMGMGMGQGVNIEIVHGPNGTVFIRKHIGKPPIIDKFVNISLEQAYTGCTVPVDVEKWSQTGETRLNLTETHNLTIHPGVNSDEHIVLGGVGNRFSDDNVGDIRFIIVIDKHPTFQRNGLNLCYKKSLTLKEALCGTQFNFKHLNGKNIALNISNSIISPGVQKEFPGFGMISGTDTGSLIVDFDVVFPSTLTQEQRDTISTILL